LTTTKKQQKSVQTDHNLGSDLMHDLMLW